jgi:UDP-GlcNAc:undecaprenyl-phosphate/decaprenyl-phosphate GlcNAc-1-phosphate transferase
MMVDLLNFISENAIIYGICGLLLATVLSMCFVPALRKLAMVKNFTDSPSARKSHSSQVPILGGVAVYLSAALPIAVFAIFYDDDVGLDDTFLLGLGALTLLVIGVLDDIKGLKPRTKLIFQIIIAYIAVYVAQLNIENMNGLLGLFELPKIISLTLSLFVFIVFMNMLNLIDGIDGLASGLSLIAFVFFAFSASMIGNSFILLICMSSIGSLLPFIYFNMFSDKKIFLGDNGSLVLGFILGFLTLKLLSSNIGTEISMYGENTSLVLMSLFSYPLVDTLRVFMVRILRKRSPFTADKNHLHHHLLRLVLLHRQATLLILVYTVIITIISYFLSELNINLAFVILLAIAMFCTYLPTFLEHKTDGSLKFKFYQ